MLGIVSNIMLAAVWLWYSWRRMGGLLRRQFRVAICRLRDTDTAKFERFRDLPFELREMIWRSALDEPMLFMIQRTFPPGGPPGLTVDETCSRLSGYARLHPLGPTTQGLASACSESRALFLKTHCEIVFRGCFGSPKAGKALHSIGIWLNRRSLIFAPRLSEFAQHFRYQHLQRMTHLTVDKSLMVAILLIAMRELVASQTLLTTDCERQITTYDKTLRRMRHVALDCCLREDFRAKVSGAETVARDYVEGEDPWRALGLFKRLLDEWTDAVQGAVQGWSSQTDVNRKRHRLLAIGGAPEMANRGYVKAVILGVLGGVHRDEVSSLEFIRHFRP
jgi:hypothetical protein